MTIDERAPVWVVDHHRSAADAIAEIAHGLAPHPRSRALVLCLIAVLGCNEEACPDIGCIANLVLTVDPVVDLARATGTFAVGGGHFSVDCAVESPNFDCNGNVVKLYLGWNDVTEPVDVTWSLRVPATNGTAEMEGAGTFRPDWEAGEYTTPDCLPGCWFGAGTVTVGPSE